MIPGSKKRAFNFNDLMMVVALARKHLRLVVLLVCLTSTAGLVFYVFSKPVYYSRSLVRVDIATPLPLDSETVYHDSSLSALGAQLSSPLIMVRTALKFGIHGDGKQISEKFIKKVGIKRNAEGNFEVEVWAYSLPLARKWCETMIGVFLEHREAQRLKHRESVINSFTQEMAHISEKIETTSAEKSEYRTKRNVMGTMIALNQLKNVPADLARTKRRMEEAMRVSEKLSDPHYSALEKLAILSAVEKEVQLHVGQTVKQASMEGEQSSESKKEEGPASVVVLPAATDNSTPWEELARTQMRIQNEIQEASLIYLPGHRKMVELNKELEKITRAIDLEYEVAKGRFDLQIQELANKAHDLEAKLPEYQRVNKQQEKIAQEAQLFSSGQLAWNGMYSEMAKQIEKLDWTSERERANLQFLDVVESKDQPVSPYWAKIALISIFAGLALGVGIPFLIEFLDHTVSTLEEVESVFQLRGLGIIPQVSSVEQERPVLLDDVEGDRNLVENFRVIRTNLLSVGSLSKEPQVIMITSSMPKEGKTVVSSNLALSFAQTGAKTLLLDTDLRRGRLHRLFGLRKGPGLSGLLYDKTTLEEACRPTGKEGLTIMTSGQHVESGTEMLGTPKFAELMAELRGRYDRIIIDTPPVLGLSETSIIQPHTDGVMFVVWGGRTPLRSMKVAVEMLQANGANMYGFILNRLDLSATTNYYQYYYYSNDYYHNYHAIENA